MVGFCRVGPPGINVHFMQVAEVTPVQVAGIFVERVVRMCTRFRRPCLKFQQGSHLVQLLELVGPWSEAGPYGNHQVCIVLMYVFHHFFRAFEARFRIACILVFSIRKVAKCFLVVHLVDVAWIHEFHGIPVGVTSPVLPVLYDTIQRNLKFAVFVEYAAQFVRTLVAFAALPVTHGPEREHGSLSGQVADAGDYAILCAVFVQEIIIGAKSYL